MVTVIGCDSCEAPVLTVVVTEEFEFRCEACALAFSFAAAVVTDEEVEECEAAVAREEYLDSLVALAA